MSGIQHGQPSSSHGSSIHGQPDAAAAAAAAGALINPFAGPPPGRQIPRTPHNPHIPDLNLNAIPAPNPSPDVNQQLNLNANPNAANQNANPIPHPIPDVNQNVNQNDGQLLPGALPDGGGGHGPLVDLANGGQNGLGDVVRAQQQQLAQPQDPGRGLANPPGALPNAQQLQQDGPPINRQPNVGQLGTPPHHIPPVPDPRRPLIPRTIQPNHNPLLNPNAPLLNASALNLNRMSPLHVSVPRPLYPAVPPAPPGPPPIDPTVELALLRQQNQALQDERNAVLRERDRLSIERQQFQQFRQSEQYHSTERPVDRYPERQLTSPRAQLPEHLRPHHVPPPNVARQLFSSAASHVFEPIPRHHPSVPQRHPDGTATAVPPDYTRHPWFPPVLAPPHMDAPPAARSQFMNRDEVASNTRRTHPYLDDRWNGGVRSPNPQADEVAKLRHQVRQLTDHIQQGDGYYQSHVPTAPTSVGPSASQQQTRAPSRAAVARDIVHPNPWAPPLPPPLHTLDPVRPLQMPPMRRFSGRDPANPTDDTPFSDWERELRSALLSSNTRPTTWLSTMRMFLAGPAAKLYDFLISAPDEIDMTYDAMVQSLTQTYDTGATAPDAKTQLSSLSWNSQFETIPEFYARIERLTQLANPTFDSAITRTLARTTFIEALPLSVERRLTDKLIALRPAIPSTRTLIAWTTEIATTERQMREHEKSRAARRKDQPADKEKKVLASGSVVETSPDPSKSPSSKGGGRDRDQRRNPDRRRRDGGQFTNPAVSNDARNTGPPQPSNLVPGYSTDAGHRGDAPRPPLSTVQCFHCQQMGHYKSDCPYLQPPPPPPNAPPPVVSMVQQVPPMAGVSPWGQLGSYPMFYPSTQPPSHPHTVTDPNQPSSAQSQLPAHNIISLIEQLKGEVMSLSAAPAVCPLGPHASSRTENVAPPEVNSSVHMLTMPITISGHTVTAQVDTGSPITILGSRPFHRLIEQEGRSSVFARIRPSSRQFADYSGNPVGLMNMIALNLGIQGGTLQSDVYIDPQSHRDLIIGMDVLAQIDCSFTFTCPPKLNCVVPAVTSDVSQSSDTAKSMTAKVFTPAKGCLRPQCVVQSVTDNHSLLPPLPILSITEQVVSPVSDRTVSGPCKSLMSAPTTGAARRRRERRKRAKRRSQPASVAQPSIASKLADSERVMCVKETKCVSLPSHTRTRMAPPPNFTDRNCRSRHGDDGSCLCLWSGRRYPGSLDPQYLSHSRCCSSAISADQLPSRGVCKFHQAPYFPLSSKNDRPRTDSQLMDSVVRI